MQLHWLFIISALWIEFYSYCSLIVAPKWWSLKLSIYFDRKFVELSWLVGNFMKFDFVHVVH